MVLLTVISPCVTLKAGERMSMCCDPSGLQAAISVPTFREGTLINKVFGGIII